MSVFNFNFYGISNIFIDGKKENIDKPLKKENIDEPLKKDIDEQNIDKPIKKDLDEQNIDKPIKKDLDEQNIDKPIKKDLDEQNTDKPIKKDLDEPLKKDLDKPLKEDIENKNFTTNYISYHKNKEVIEDYHILDKPLEEKNIDVKNIKVITEDYNNCYKNVKNKEVIKDSSKNNLNKEVVKDIINLLNDFINKN